MATQVQNERWSISRPSGSIHEETTEFGNYRSGVVKTFHGIVAVYAQDERPFTRLTFLLNGQWFDRTINGKSYTARGLVTLANRYAKECVIESEAAK